MLDTEDLPAGSASTTTDLASTRRRYVRRIGMRPRTYRRERIETQVRREATPDLAPYLALVDLLHPQHGGRCPRLYPTVEIDGEQISLVREDGHIACPWASCPGHNYLAAKPNGALYVTYPDLSPHEIPYPCALEAISWNSSGMSLDEMAKAYNLTRQGAGLLESRLLARLRMIAVFDPMLRDYAEIA